MEREQLLHVARTAADLTNHDRILVLGSQSVLGSFSAHELPAQAIMSIEADLVVWDPLTDDTPHVIEANIGRSSLFHGTHGYYADGMTLDEATLPEGWEGRIRTLRTSHALDEEKTVTVYCLEVHDLCASKLSRGDMKDTTFTAALIEAELVDPAIIAERVRLLPDVGGRSRGSSALVRAKQQAQHKVMELDAPPPEPTMTPTMLATWLRRSCTGTTLAGTSCQNPPRPGQRRCHLH